MLNITQQVGGEVIFHAEELCNSDYIKSTIRQMKLEALSRMLDGANHRRYWTISFREEWVDVERELGYHNYMNKPRRPGDKIFKLYCYMSEAQRQRVVIAIPDAVSLWEIPNVKHAQTFYHKIKERFWGLLSGES